MDDTVKGIARPATSRSLQEAVRKARVEEAYRLDETADRRDSEIARLELMKAELQVVFAEIPANDDRFTLMLVPSRPARLWVDLFTYVAVDDASGAYLFIRNSESGRRTLYSTASVSEMADRITQLYGARDRAPGAARGGADRAAATGGAACFAAGTCASRHGGRGCGLHHRPSHRRRGPLRRGVAHHALEPHDSRRIRRSHSKTWVLELRDGAADHLATPAIIHLADAVFVVARGGNSPGHRLRRRRDANDDRRPGHGRKLEQRLLVIVPMQHELCALLLEQARQLSRVAQAAPPADLAVQVAGGG